MRRWLWLPLGVLLGCGEPRDTPAFSGDGAGPDVVRAPGTSDETTTSAVLARKQADFGWGPSKCQAAPNGEATGYDVGQQIPRDMVFRDESGAPVQLAELCGARAVWLFFAHVWCPPCNEAGSMAEELALRYVDDEIAVVQVVVSDVNNLVPDAEDCATWRDTYDQLEALTLYDPVESYIDLELTDATALSVMLDKDQLIYTKFHGTDRDAFVQTLEAAAGL